ncbi:hypothetical protein BHM03_00055866 [Ensete ventricosum]|nr:hypothetical protein BHM03_00055866 [Ensete ventricosum]
MRPGPSPSSGSLGQCSFPRPQSAISFSPLPRSKRESHLGRTGVVGLHVCPTLKVTGGVLRRDFGHGMTSWLPLFFACQFLIEGPYP